MQQAVEPPPPASLRRRGIYLLPNLLTTTSLFAGFYSMVAVLKSNFEYAAIAIFIAMLADTLDGRVARLTNTQTEFGVQYDSLADMASFGVATAFLVYNWALAGLGKFGWLVAFVFTAATALRLARFNTQAVSGDKRYFQGLPCPVAAGVIAGMVWWATEYQLESPALPMVVAISTLALAFSMVSNIRYYSFKKLDKGKVPFIRALLVVLIFACVAIDPAAILFLTLLTFALSGPVLTIRSRRQQRRMHAAKHIHTDES